jgi:3-oxoacyl-[acyl-carrier protein] reductase
MAVELGRKKIRVNAVAPGVILTEMSERVRDHAGDDIKKRVPLRRFGTPEDVAAVVHFLASDAASYMTGQILTVDGGMCGG